MLEQASELGVGYFDISGGEPLALPEKFILNVITYASEIGLGVSISTNGYWLDSSKLAIRLRNAGLGRVKLSLYGTAPDTHDGFTGVPGSFYRLLRALGLSKEVGFETWVNAVVTPANLAEIRLLPALLKPYQPDLVQVSSLVPSGRGEEATAYKFSVLDLPSVVGRLQNATKGLRCAFTITLFSHPEQYPYGNRYCDYLVERIVVEPNGDLVPCCLLPRSMRSVLGNVTQNDLRDILSIEQIDEHSISRWLYRGHKAMNERLGNFLNSPNLCANCIDMLYRLTSVEL
jgi:MoaA/NifB/PqqE/SkfB family radical SAM enzyme